MGVRAYNRGSKVLSDQLDREQRLPPRPERTERPPTEPIQQKGFRIGQRVYCTVHGAEGWHDVIAVRESDRYIKIDGCRSWCPPYNFNATGERT